MATIFLWCCRRVRRANSPDPPTSDNKDTDHSGEQEGKGRSARSKSLTAQIERKFQPKKKKKKGKEIEEEAKQEEDELGDLCAVKRETEVLKSYQKPPPPKNRARASRALRTLKSQNPGTSHDIFQVLDEIPTDLLAKDGPGQKAGSSQQDSQELDDNSSAAVHSTDDGVQSVLPPPSENLNLSKQTSVEIENASHADDDDTQKDSSVSKEEATPEPSDQEEPKEPLAAEPADSGGQEAVCKTSSPKTSQSEDVTPECTNEDASLNPEGETSVTVQTKNDVSSISSADGGGDVDSEGEDASQEEEVREDLEEPGKTCALVELNASSINSDAAAEDHIKMVSLGPASSFKDPSSSVKHTSGKGKRCPIPSVHGEGMDELMKCLQNHLNEDGTSPCPVDKTADQKMDGSEQEPVERVRSHSDPTHHLDGTEDAEHQTADSQE